MSQTVSAAAVTATVAAPVTAPAPAPVKPAGAAAHAKASNPLASGLRPLALDVAAPLAGYYLLHSACGLSEFAALAWSSAFPAARTVLGLLRERSLNLWAALMLTVNVAGLALTFVTGDARLMIAKDGGLSGTVAIAILVSALIGRPVMSPMLMPFVTKGKRDRACLLYVYKRQVLGHLGHRAAGRVRGPGGRRLHPAGLDHGLAVHRVPDRRDRGRFDARSDRRRADGEAGRRRGRGPDRRLNSGGPSGAHRSNGQEPSRSPGSPYITRG